MKPGLAEHPSPQQLSAFGLGNLDSQTHAAVEQHVAGCDTCCDALRQVRNDTLVEMIRSTQGPSAADTNPLPANSPRPRPMIPPDTPPELADHPRYRIISRLGAGGMGVVYRAEHRMMERPVALKVISSEILDHPQAVDRFRQEVKAAARLLHPNIVAAHDAEQAGSQHFLVMEYVDGTSLARVVEKRGPLPILNACHYARQAALGLQHAHQHGMVHRDIKPQNLMLTRRGQVKILDFGLARLAREHDTDAKATRKDKERASLTSLGTVLGTPDYIAPEQASDSRKADIRSDIYSLGCTLYFLLTGRVPFPGGSSVEKMMQHSLDKPAALTELRPDAPAELVAVVEKMMAKKPENRYQSPTELAVALLPFARTSSSEPPDEPLAVAMLIDDADTPPALKGADTTLGRPRRERTRSRTRFRPRRQTFLNRHSAQLIGLGVVLLVVTGAVTAFVKYALPHLQGKEDGGASSVAKSDAPPGPESRRPREIDEPRSSRPGDDGNAAPAAPPSRPDAAGGKRVLLVIASRRFFYPDYGPVKTILENAGAGIVVTTAASAPGPAEPMFPERHPSVNPDITLAQARADDFELVVFCGGEGVLFEYCREGPHHQTAKNFIQEMLDQNKYVTALCGGPAVLADAGVLQGVRAICWFGDERYKRKLLMSGCKAPEDKYANVVESGKIITGRSPESAEEFARTLVRVLRGGN